MNRIRKTAITLLLLLSACWAMAQPYSYVRTFNIRDGLAANNISSITQTSDGLMWFATWNGLCCYDGYRFTTYRGQVGSQEVLTSNRIVNINANSCGNIWCITYDHVLYLFDTRQGRFFNVSDLVYSKFKQKPDFRNIYTLQNGHTWITCDTTVQAVFCFDDQQATSEAGITRYVLDGKQLPGKSMHRVMADNDGHETIVTQTGMLLLQSGLKIDIPGDYMQQIGHRVYYASPQGQLVSFDKKTKRITPIRMPEGVTAVNCMIQSGNQIFIGTNVGIVHADPQRNSTRLISIKGPTHPSEEVTAVYRDSKERLWAFNHSGGIVMLHPKDLSPRWLQTQQPEQHFQVTSSKNPFWLEDRYHTIWLVPKEGTYCYYDEQAERLIPFELHSIGYTHANIPIISKYFIDQQRNVWMGSTSDLTLIQFNYRKFKQVTELPTEETRALCSTHSGQLWTGGDNNHVIIYDTQGHRLGYLNAQGKIQPQETKFPGRVFCFYEDSHHRIWLGTRGNGLYLLEPSGQLRHFTHDASDGRSLSDDNIFSVDEDERGHIWVGTYGQGLNLVEEHVRGDISFIHAGNQLKGYPKGFDRVRHISHDGQGVVLVSTTSGLLTFSNQFKDAASIRFYQSTHHRGDTTSLMTVDVLQTLPNRDGSIFVSTMGGGIQQLTSDNLLADNLTFRTLKGFNPEEGNAWSMTEDWRGDLWVVRESTINRMCASTGVVEQFGPNDLDNRTEFTEAISAVNADGRIIVATMGGYVSFLPQDIEKDDSRPNIVFTRVQYHGSDDFQPVLNTERLEIESHQRSFTIHFAALDYADNYLMKYAYRLDDEDGGWNYIGNTPHISFSNLSPGEHVLVVKSTNCDGVWADNETRLTIYVQPMWWERLWVQLLGLLLVVGLATAAVLRYLSHRRHTKEREQRLENIMRQYRELQETVGTVENGELRTESCDMPKDSNSSEQSNHTSQFSVHSSQLTMPPHHYHLEEPKIVNEDDEMMDRLMQFIESRISDDELKIEEMAEAVGMSRSVFFVKIKSLVGMAPIDFLRHLRMERAKQLVELSTMNVSQIAYSVGFTDPKYFTRCFKKEMGCTPTELREQHANQKGN